MPPSSSCPAADEAVAYYASSDVLDRDADALSRALAWLTDAERERYERFRADADRRMFLVGRVMARALVGAALGAAPEAWQWRDSARGRPEIAAPETALQFNLSHSAGLVACALSTGRAVGIDVEHLARRPVDHNLVRRYCSPAEAEDIDARGDAWLPRFLHYWTLKEAYLKARGLGVSVPLAEIEFREAPGPRGQAPGGQRPTRSDEVLRGPARSTATGGGQRPRAKGQAPETSAHIEIAFLGSLAGTDDGWTFILAQPTADHILAVAVEGRSDVSIAIRPMPIELLP